MGTKNGLRCIHNRLRHNQHSIVNSIGIVTPHKVGLFAPEEQSRHQQAMQRLLKDAMWMRRRILQSAGGRGLGIGTQRTYALGRSIAFVTCSTGLRLCSRKCRDIAALLRGRNELRSYMLIFTYIEQLRAGEIKCKVATIRAPSAGNQLVQNACFYLAQATYDLLAGFRIEKRLSYFWKVQRGRRDGICRISKRLGQTARLDQRLQVVRRHIL